VSWTPLAAALRPEPRMRFLDSSIRPETSYEYRVSAAFLGGGSEAATALVRTPRSTFALSGAEPNPSSGACALHFSLSRAGQVSLEIINVSGRRVRTLLRGSLGTGPRAVTWDGRDDRGQSVAAGIYFVRLSSGASAAVRTIVHLR